MSPFGLATSVSRLQRRQPIPVEAGSQVCYCIAAVPAGGPGCLGEALTVRHGQQLLGPGNVGGGFGVGPVDAFQVEV